jgi:hypothetical protein
MRLMVAGAAHLANRSALYDLTGEGASAYHRGVARYFPTANELRMTEVDWMDIFGAYGIGFTVLIHAFVMLVLASAAWRFFAQRDSLHGIIAGATLIYFGHSALAGHALVSPIPSTLLAGYCALYFSKIANASWLGRKAMGM